MIAGQMPAVAKSCSSSNRKWKYCEAGPQSRYSFGLSALRAAAGEGRRCGFACARDRDSRFVACRKRAADRGQGRGRQSVGRQGCDRVDALRGISAYAGPRLCRRRDRWPRGLDRARSVRLLRRSRHPPRRHPRHASGRRSRRGSRKAQKHFVGGGRRHRRALCHRDGGPAPRRSSQGR